MLTGLSSQYVEAWIHAIVSEAYGDERGVCSRRERSIRQPAPRAPPRKAIALNALEAHPNLHRDSGRTLSDDARERGR
jgi:hypothetical protein